MPVQDKKKLLQYTGGGVIIAGAAAIMLPDLVNYLFGLWRIITLIATILITAYLLVFIMNKLKPRSKAPSEGNGSGAETSESQEQ